MSFSFLNPIGCIQERILFPRDMAPPPFAKPLIGATIEWTRERPSGSKGVAWYIPTSDAAPANPRPCVVLFHGNAEIIDYQTEEVRAYRELGCSALLPEYPGYGRSEGLPSQQSIVDDAEFFYRKLIEQPGVDASRIIFHGRSLGGAVAAQLAARHEPAALILQSTFTSVPAVAARYLVPHFLIRHPFHTDRVIPTLQTPVLIFHGSHDEIVPVAHGRTLRDLTAKPGTNCYVEYDCGHNDFPGEGNELDYWRNIERFLDANGVVPARQNEKVSNDP